MSKRSFGLLAAICIPAAFAPTGLAQAPHAAANPASSAENRPRLGITVEENNGAVTIVTINPKGAAAAAGLKVGDQLVSIDGEAISSIDALTTSIAKHRVGDQAKVAVRRGAESMDVVVHLAAAPAAGSAAPESSVRTGPALGGKPGKAEKAAPPDEVAKEEPAASPGPQGGDHGFLGVSLMDDGGVTIGQVLDDGPADKGGLREGDVVKSIAGQAIASTDELRGRLASTKPGDEVEIVVVRDGEEKARTIRLGRADEVAMAGSGQSAGDERPGAGRGVAKRFRFPATSGGGEKVQLNPPANQPKVSQPGARGWLGVYLQQGEGGVAVQSVVEDGPAAKSGLREGDVITHVGDMAVTEADEIVETVRSHAPGDTLAFKIKREGQEHQVEVALGKNPNAGAVAMPVTPEPPTAPEAAPPRAAERRARTQAQARGPSIVLAPNQVLTAKVVANGDGSYRIEWGDGKTLAVPADGRRVVVLQAKGDEGVELMLVDPNAAGGRMIRALEARPPAQGTEEREGGK